MTLFNAIKAAFDSLVRTYSPMIIGAVLGGLAVIFGPIDVPDEVAQLVTLVVALLFQMLWYGILRVYELVTGQASKLLGLGLVKSDPVYDLTKVTHPSGEQTWMTRAEYRAYLQSLADDADQANAERDRE